MRRYLPLVIMLAACAEAPPPPPRFAPMACASEPACGAAYQAAAGHAARCHSGTRTGFTSIDRLAAAATSCDGEDRAVRDAYGRLTFFQQQARQQQFAYAQQQAAAAAQTAAAQHEASEQARRDAAQHAEEQRVVAQHQSDDAEWVALDMKGCSERGDSRACEELVQFIRQHPGNGHQAEVGAALATGREVAAKVGVQEADRARKEATRLPAPQQQPRRRAQAPSSPSPPPPPDVSHICCCDGSRSPDCVTPHAGCCEGHGGPCSCK